MKVSGCMRCLGGLLLACGLGSQAVAGGRRRDQLVDLAGSGDPVGAGAGSAARQHGLAERDAGGGDAELGHYAAKRRAVPAQIRVAEVPVLYLLITMFLPARKVVTPGNVSWEGLRSSGLRVGRVCGSRHGVADLPAIRFDCAPDPDPDPDPEAALRMLLAGRVDVWLRKCVTFWASGVALPAAFSSSPGAIREVAVRSKEPIDDHVHERHAALVPALCRFFAQARKHGSADKLVCGAIVGACTRARASRASPAPISGVAP